MRCLIMNMMILYYSGPGTTYPLVPKGSGSKTERSNVDVGWPGDDHGGPGIQYVPTGLAHVDERSELRRGQRGMCNTRNCVPKGRGSLIGTPSYVS